jgi:hypothetical protein
MEYQITNFYNEKYTRTIAEVIPHGKLKEQMTNHGLGSGLYGFIDVNQKKESIKIYNRNGNTPMQFIMKNPLILNGEHNFYIFSTCLNSVIANLYNSLQTQTPLHAKTYTKETISLALDSCKYYSFEDEKITENFTPTKESLIRCITNFLSDYDKLMETDKDEENYVFMPINYVLDYYGFDGIYNISDDGASRGSVCYKFDEKYKVRGYPATFKQRIPLKGKLFYLD